MRPIETISYESSQKAPTIEDQFAADLPQVNQDEIHAPRRIVFAATTGKIFNRQYKHEIRILFPGIQFPMVIRRTRYVVIINEADPNPQIVPWKLEKHGEFKDIKLLPLDPLELQQLLHKTGIIDDQIAKLTENQIRNARKKHASTRVFPNLE